MPPEDIAGFYIYAVPIEEPGQEPVWIGYAVGLDNAWGDSSVDFSQSCYLVSTVDVEFVESIKTGPACPGCHREQSR